MSESPLSATAMPTGREVLVVEDEVRLRNMLAQALPQMGFNPTLAGSAEAAQRILATRAFDILILDLNLPGLGGMDFLDLLRKEQKDLQVIILTGFGDLDAARRAIHNDVVEFLTKPCALGGLEIALDRASKRRRGQIITAGSDEEPRQFETAPKAPAPATTVVPAEGMWLEELEQRHILNVLQRHEGNRAAAAAELGISLRKLYYRIGEYQKKGVVI